MSCEVIQLPNSLSHPGPKYKWSCNIRSHLLWLPCILGELLVFIVPISISSVISWILYLFGEQITDIQMEPLAFGRCLETFMVDVGNWILVSDITFGAKSRQSYPPCSMYFRILGFRFILLWFSQEKYSDTCQNFCAHNRQVFSLYRLN